MGVEICLSNKSHGEVPEWPKGYDWKSYVQKCTEGSNPSLSAIILESVGRSKARVRKFLQDSKNLTKP